MKVFISFLDGCGGDNGIRESVQALTEAYVEKQKVPVYNDSANVAAKAAILGALGGSGGLLAGGIASLKLKKTTTNHKTMFAGNAGKITNNGAAKSDAAKTTTDGRRALSKLVDFPGNKAEIARQLEDDTVDPAGRDFYGLTALQKFASWNKTELIELILPKLTEEEKNAVDKEGKTALHWAVEMAAVASVKALVAAGLDVNVKNNKGLTVKDVLDQAASSGIIDRLKKAIEV